MTKIIHSTERLLLANQFRILAKLNADGYQWERLVRIVEEGITSYYPEVFAAIGTEISPGTQQEVHNILTMFDHIYQVVEQLSSTEQKALEADLDYLKFTGFNRTHEGDHYGFLDFLITEDNKYRRLSKQINTYERRLDAYINMYKVYKSNRYSQQLTSNDLLKLIEVAKSTPDV